MTKEEVKELLPIMQAFAEGDEIQYRNNYNEWIDVKTGEGLCFERDSSCYRIKPEPKYSPFKSQEECWKEMQKHQPFGWTKLIGKTGYSHITDVDDEILYSDAFKGCTFADGTPFGIREE